MRTALILCLLLVLFPWTNPAAWADEKPLEIDLDELDATEVLLMTEDGLPEMDIDLGEGDVIAEGSLEPEFGNDRALTVIEAGSFGGATDIASVLERVPGVDVRSQGGAGQPVAAMVRGAKGNQVLVLIDGARITGSGSADLSLLPLGNIERVEVLRGPAVSRFGPGALGGVVNIITVKPQQASKTEQDTDTTNKELAQSLFTPAEKRSRTQLSIMAGGHSYIQTDISQTGPDGSFYLSAYQARNNFEFERTGGGGATRVNNEALGRDAWAAWRGGGWDYRLGAGHRRTGVPGSAEFPTRQASLSRDSLWFQAAGDRQRYDISLSQSRFTNPEPYLNAGGIMNQSTYGRVEYSVGTLADGAGSWGLRPYVDHIDSDGEGTHSRPGLDAHYHFVDDGNRTRLELDAGLHVCSDEWADPSAHAGLTYRLDKSSDVSLSAGYAVRYPAFDELYYLDTGGVRGNPDLDPERVLSVESRYTLTGPRTRFEAGAFLNKYRDSIIWAPVSSYLVEARNTGRATIAGCEALLDHSFTPSLWWRTAYTWLPYAEYASGTPLTGRATNRLNSRLEYFSGPFTGAVSIDHTGSIPADLFGNLRTDPRTITGLELAYGQDGRSIGITVNNLFDVAARDSWNYPLPGREVYINWRTDL